MRLVFSRQAEADLEEIGDYIARDNPQRALGFLQELHAHCRRIADAPLAARERPELRKGLRSAPFQKYVVLFVVERNDRVLIARILHGARDLSQALDQG